MKNVNMYFVYFCLEEEAEWTHNNESFEVFFDCDKAMDFAQDVRGKVYDADITSNGGFEVGPLLYNCTESPDLWEEVWKDFEAELQEDLASLEPVNEEEF